MKRIFIATALVSALGLTGCSEHPESSTNSGQQDSAQHVGAKAGSQNNFQMQEGDISLECKGKLSPSDADEITINIIYSPRLPEISKIYSNISENQFRGDHIPRKTIKFRESDVNSYQYVIGGNSFSGNGEFFSMSINRKDLSVSLQHNNSLEGLYFLHFNCVNADKSYFTNKATEYANKMDSSNSLNKI